MSLRIIDASSRLLAMIASDRSRDYGAEPGRSDRAEPAATVRRVGGTL